MLSSLVSDDPTSLACSNNVSTVTKDFLEPFQVQSRAILDYNLAPTRQIPNGCANGYRIGTTENLFNAFYRGTPYLVSLL